MTKWQTVMELDEGEFRVRKVDGKCLLERKVETTENVTEECRAELYCGPCTPSGCFYIRIMHGDKVIALVPAGSTEMRAGNYKLDRVGGYSFRIIKTG